MGGKSRYMQVRYNDCRGLKRPFPMIVPIPSKRALSVRL